jgi:hypothetical protein
VGIQNGKQTKMQVKKNNITAPIIVVSVIEFSKRVVTEAPHAGQITGIDLRGHL